MSTQAPIRTSLQIFRDIQRLIRHIAGTNSAKAKNLRNMAADQFRENMHETDPQKIEEMKAKAQSLLTSYMLVEQSFSDPSFRAKREEMMEHLAGRNVEESDDGKLYEVSKAPVVESVQTAATGVRASAGGGGAWSPSSASAARATPDYGAGYALKASLQYTSQFSVGNPAGGGKEEGEEEGEGATPAPPQDR